MWRGRPLADLEFESFARLEVRRLEALRLQVVEDRIDAELATGRHTALCSELEQLVAEHPLRERLRGQLMLALYRSGRQADALETYRAGRALLVHELAVEPGPQLRQLQLAILAQDPALDLPRPPSGPAPPPPREVPAGPAAPGEASRRSGSHPGRRRRTRRVGLALGAPPPSPCSPLVPLPRHGTATMPVNANLLALISPAMAAVQATVPLRAPPADVAAASGSVWVAEPDAGLVARIDP